jgi:hypothetical protein
MVAPFQVAVSGKVQNRVDLVDDPGFIQIPPVNQIFHLFVAITSHVRALACSTV